MEDSRPLAVITGASSGIGFELSKVFVGADFGSIEVVHSVGELHEDRHALRRPAG